MDDTAVQALYRDYIGLRDGPLADDPSGLSALELTYPKVLLVASASYLEVYTCALILEGYSPLAPELTLFVFRGALYRKFHGLFDWSTGTATKFFAFFGKEFSDAAKARVKADAEFGGAASAFVEVGHLRNQMVHENFAEFSLSKTATEVMELHERAKTFPRLVLDMIDSGRAAI